MAKNGENGGKPTKRRKEIVIVGLGRFGSSLARELYQRGHSVLVIDRDENRVQEMVGAVTHAVTGDATREEVLGELGVEHYDIGIVAIGGEIKESIMVAVLLKSIGVPHIVARAHSKLHGNTLERLGCQRVIHVEEEMGGQVASTLLSPQNEHAIQLGGNFVVNLWKSRSTETGRKVATLGFKSDGEGVTVLAIKRAKEVVLNPSLDYELQAGDELLLAGNDDKITKLLDALDEQDPS